MTVTEAAPRGEKVKAWPRSKARPINEETRR